MELPNEYYRKLDFWKDNSELEKPGRDQVGRKGGRVKGWPCLPSTSPFSFHFFYFYFLCVCFIFSSPLSLETLVDHNQRWLPFLKPGRSSKFLGKPFKAQIPGSLAQGCCVMLSDEEARTTALTFLSNFLPMLGISGYGYNYIHIWSRISLHPTVAPILSRTLWGAGHKGIWVSEPVWLLH